MPKLDSSESGIQRSTLLVIWDGQYRTIDINESETVPLIGMRLLRGYDLHIQAIEGGSVRIEALPNRV